MTAITTVGACERVSVRAQRAMQVASAATRSLVVAGALFAAAAAQAQFNAPPKPLNLGDPAPSQAVDSKAYRTDGARHLYYSYPMQVHRGQLPSMLTAVAIVETTIDEQGAVEKIDVVREPAVTKEATPWLVAMIRGAAPYPVASKQGKVVYKDIWLITEDGKFQLDSLTEGQAHNKSAAVEP